MNYEQSEHVFLSHGIDKTLLDAVIVSINKAGYDDIRLGAEGFHFRRGTHKHHIGFNWMTNNKNTLLCSTT